LRRRRLLLLAAVLVPLSGLVAFCCVLLLAPKPPEPPAVPMDGVEKPVAAAIAAARERLLQQPASAEAWGQLGKLFLAHSFFLQADKCFAQAEQLDGKQPRWPYYRGLIAAQEDNRFAPAHLRRAVERGDRSDPGVLSTRLRLAEVLLEQGQDEEAEENLRVVAAKDPNNPWLLYHRGLRALAHDDPGAAVARLARLTQHPSARKKACAQLAMAYRRLGDEGQAAAFTRQAAQLPADAPWEDPYVEEYEKLQVGAHGRLQQVRALEAEGKIPEVVALLSGINRDTESDLAHLALGINLIKLGQFNEAERALRDTLALYPDKVPAHYYLAVVLYLQAEDLSGAGGGLPESARAKYRESAEHLRRAVELKPDHSLAHMNLGRVLRALGQPDEGMKELRLAVDCKPDEARPHFFLAEALADDGQAEEGVRQLELALRLIGNDDFHPSDATVQRVREKLGKPK
jgi:tetratricopeptide (TPR) repeat protein